MQPNQGYRPDARQYQPWLGKLLEIIDPDGNVHRWNASPDIIAGTRDVFIASAQSLGLTLAVGLKARRQFVGLIQQWNPKTRAKTTNRLGWTDSTCTSFVLGNGDVLGIQDVVFQSDQVSTTAARMHKRGTLDQWQIRVVSMCVGNPLWITAICVALSGPLLEFMEAEGGGLHLRGSACPACPARN